MKRIIVRQPENNLPNTSQFLPKTTNNAKIRQNQTGVDNER